MKLFVYVFENKRVSDGSCFLTAFCMAILFGIISVNLINPNKIR